MYLHLKPPSALGTNSVCGSSYRWSTLQDLDLIFVTAGWLIAATADLIGVICVAAWSAWKGGGVAGGTWRIGVVVGVFHMFFLVGGVCGFVGWV